MLAHNVDTEALAEERSERWIGARRGDRHEPPIGKIAQAWAESKAQHRAEREHVVGSPAGVGEMLVNPQDAAVVQEPVEDVGASWVAAEITFTWKGPC